MSDFEDAIGRGGVVLFPSDTVYGLACDPENPEAIEKLYAIKGRAPEKAAAVMFFDLDTALAAVPELGQWTRAALRVLMPGAVTALVPNPAHRFPLACREDPETLGLRVIDAPAIGTTAIPVLQSSANLAGGPDARTLADVEESIRAAVDLWFDGGDLEGVPSTVVDLRYYETAAAWSVERLGAVDEDEVDRLLVGLGRDGWYV